MKKIIIAIAFAALLPGMVLAQSRKFIIDGKIQADTLSTGRIYLSYEDSGHYHLDSATIKNNTYHFEGEMEDGAIRTNLRWLEPVKGRSMAKMPYKGFSQFYTVPGHINLLHKEEFKNIIITGSPVQDDQIMLDKQLRARLHPEKEIKSAYIAAHPDSWLSYILLEQLVRSKSLNLDTADHLYANLSPALKSRRQVKTIKALLIADRTAVIGNSAIEFTENDVNGKPVSLSSYRGKYLLVDFWASWCHPCRAENPVVAKAFNKYKGKNFDVLGVSLDAATSKKAWLDAIKQDGVTWTQVSNLKGFDDEAAVKYGITSIPRNYLIDPRGKIIAKDLRGPALEQKLEELFK